MNTRNIASIKSRQGRKGFQKHKSTNLLRATTQTLMPALVDVFLILEKNISDLNNGVRFEDKTKKVKKKTNAYTQNSELDKIQVNRLEERIDLIEILFGEIKDSLGDIKKMLRDMQKTIDRVLQKLAKINAEARLSCPTI